MERWGLSFEVPFGDMYLPAEVYTLSGYSFEIMINNRREGSIGWMRVGWKFHVHRNTTITTADFIVLADIIEEQAPFEFKIEWLGWPTGSGSWPLPPLQTPHWAMLTYPKWPTVRHW